MQTFFPTTDIDEFSWYTVFNAGLECKRRTEYYHYTNLENLDKILKEDCIDLRLTRADCFADKLEMLHIVPIIEAVCAELLQKEYINREFNSTINQCVKKAQLFLREYRRFYVFCLSANGNSLYLKENYACKEGKNGVIIGIQGTAFEDIQFCIDEEQEKMVDGICMYDVIYDEEKLHDAFGKIIRNLYELSAQKAESNKAIERTISALIMHGLVYKPPAFNKEEETRMIVDFSKLTLSKGKYYQDDERYLHIKLPKDMLYEEVKVNV